MKFKVGDKVVCPKKPSERQLQRRDVVGWVRAQRRGGVFRGHTMDDWVGKVLTIKACWDAESGMRVRYTCHRRGSRSSVVWTFMERWLKAAK